MSTDRPHFAVMGTGSWGTTFAMVLADAGVPVRMWGRRTEVVDQIRTQHRNEEYLPDVELPAGIDASTDPAEVLAGAATVVLAVPSQSLRENLSGWAPLIADDALLVSLMKGVELGTHLRMSEVISQVAGVPADRVAWCRGRTSPRRSPPGSRRPPWSRAPTTTAPSASRTTARPRTSGRTPRTTWSVWSSAVR